MLCDGTEATVEHVFKDDAPTHVDLFHPEKVGLPHSNVPLVIDYEDSVWASNLAVDRLRTSIHDNVL